jgi:hypothetical protein
VFTPNNFNVAQTVRVTAVNNTLRTVTLRSLSQRALWLRAILTMESQVRLVTVVSVDDDDQTAPEVQIDTPASGRTSSRSRPSRARLRTTAPWPASK